MNIKVAAFTVSEKSINTHLFFILTDLSMQPVWLCVLLAIARAAFCKRYMSQCMRFPTMWYVQPAKPQISLRIRAV